MKRLDEVLADQAEAINMLRRCEATVTPNTLEQFRSEIVRAAEPFIRWVVEEDAAIYTDRSIRWLRSRFPGWSGAGDG